MIPVVDRSKLPDLGHGVNFTNTSGDKIAWQTLVSKFTPAEQKTLGIHAAGAIKAGELGKLLTALVAEYAPPNQTPLYNKCK